MNTDMNTGMNKNADKISAGTDKLQELFGEIFSENHFFRETQKIP